MKNFEIIGRSAQVSVNLTAEQWQLFSDMALSHQAAVALNLAAQFALSASDRETAWERMRPAMDTYMDCGASDTEPRAVFSEMLDEVFGPERY